MTRNAESCYGRRTAMFRFIVLGLLRQGGAHHGYALMKAYRSRTGVQMSTGTFYRELQHLVAEGLVRLVARAPDVDARRTPYEITPAGCEVFDHWLVRPPIIALGSDDEITARTMFLPQAAPDVARRMIDGWKEELWLLSKKLERSRQTEIQRCAAEGTPFSILTLLLARRLKHLAGDMEYLDELYTAVGELERLGEAAQSARQAPTLDGATPRRTEDKRPRGR
ncbi:MAG: PadR family transcriptional regulator, partial [Thermodesulfobacteriota bacterium]